MVNLELYPSQIEALKKMHNGCVLVGGTGSGKSRTGLAYMYLNELKGGLQINGKGKWSPPKVKKDLYIITTARKRDSHDWDKEMLPFRLSTDISLSEGKIKVIVDSWNCIQKYVNVYGALFIFDEQKTTSGKKWSKAFIKIAKRNRWIMLSATPADNYNDLVSLFIANGYFKNKTEFNMRHVVFKPYMKYPVVDHYIGTGTLNYYRRQMYVIMDSQRKIHRESQIIRCNYSKENYKIIWKKRWNYFDNEPIEESGKLCYLLRRVVNEDEDRINHLIDILKEHPTAIIFYNYSPELELLRETFSKLHYKFTEWNGEKHEEVPQGNKWVYLCQYNSCSEAWNCITTNTMIFYSLNYSYKTTVQAAGRIDRSNSPYDVLYYYYLSSYSPIDLAIQKALKEKRNFNERSFVVE